MNQKGAANGNDESVERLVPDSGFQLSATVFLCAPSMLAPRLCGECFRRIHLRTAIEDGNVCVREQCLFIKEGCARGVDSTETHSCTMPESFLQLGKVQQGV
jgi:hypothetical protein